MSGLIDCMMVVARDLGAIALEGTKSAAMMAKMSVVNTADMSKDFYAGFVNGIGDTIAALKNFAKEEKEVYKQALSNYQTSLAFDKESKKKYVSKILSSQEYMTLQMDDQSKEKMIEELTVEEANEIFSFAYLANKYKDSLIEYSSFEDVTELMKEFNDLKGEFSSSVEKGNYKVSEYGERLAKCIENLRAKLKAKLDEADKYDVEKVNEIYLALSSEAYEGFVATFNDELTTLLKETESEDLSLANKLLELKEEMINYALKLDKLEYLDGAKECQDMIEYVYETLKDESLSDELKVERVSIRVDALKDDYLKFEKSNQNIMELKEKFEHAQWRNYSYRQYLKMEVTPGSFNPNTAKEDIARLEKENKALYEECQAKQKREYVRKALKEAMIMNELDYLESRESDRGTQHIEQDIYYLDDCNVVAVTINEKGAVNYHVSSVEIDGISHDEATSVNNMHKFCEKYKDIEKRLKESGIEIEETRRLEPEIELVHNIKVSDATKDNIKNKIKKSKEGNAKEKIYRHMGD